MMERVRTLLDGYVTKRECDIKHEGVESSREMMCNKVDLVVKMMEQSQKVSLQQHAEIIEQLSELRKNHNNKG